MKGISEVATAALYIGVSIAAISTALTVGGPALENIRDASAIRNARQFMQEVDTAVQEVAAEGEGSTRTLDISIDRGRFFYDDTSNSLVYELETDAGVISPQSSRMVGDVRLTSNANVQVYNDTVDGVDCVMMENEHTKICIRHVPRESPLKDINTSRLLMLHEYKDGSRQLDGNLSVKLNGVAGTSHGQGYVTVDRYGSFIGTGRVTARVNSEYGYSYDMVFELPTGADFVRVDVTNYT